MSTVEMSRDGRVEAAVYVTPVKKYDTVVSSGQATLRALLTMNGGATIAFLTFLGRLWDKGGLQQDSIHVLVSALELFVYGTFFAVLGYGTIFLTNVLSSRDWEKTSTGMFVVTVICGVISIVCFLRASRRAVAAFEAVASLPVT